jgi:hypothetical protein
MTRIAQCANALGIHEARHYFAYGSNPVQGDIFFATNFVKYISKCWMKDSNSMLK